MTAEEIERAFQQVALSIQQLTQVAVRTDARLDASDSARREADERLDALINAQVRYEARQEKIEEAFRIVASSHAQLVEMIRLHEDRLDGHDEAHGRTDARMDALIDAQIGFDERLQLLISAQAEDRRRAEERGYLLDEKLARLQEAQTRTEEQIRLLIGRNGGEAR